MDPQSPRGGGRGAGAAGGGIRTADEKDRKKEECRFLVNHAKLPLSNNAVNSTQQTILWRPARIGRRRRGPSSRERPRNPTHAKRTTSTGRPTIRQRVRLIKKRQYSNTCESIEIERAREERVREMMKQAKMSPLLKCGWVCELRAESSSCVLFTTDLHVEMSCVPFQPHHDRPQ